VAFSAIIETLGQYIRTQWPGDHYYVYTTGEYTASPTNPPGYRYGADGLLQVLEHVDAGFASDSLRIYLNGVVVTLATTVRDETWSQLYDCAVERQFVRCVEMIDGFMRRIQPEARLAERHGTVVRQ
jgi:hypothetical protein